MNQNFQGLDPRIVLDMNRLGTQALTDIQRMWRAYPDILGLVDDQITLLHKNVMLKHNAENIRHGMRMGSVSPMAGVVTVAGINRAVADNASEIRANGLIILSVISVHMSGQKIEA